MDTTTYGYLNPTIGDKSKGSLNGWMYAMNFNIDRFDGHTHNGVDSPLLSIPNFSPYTVIAEAADWVVNSGGTGLPSTGFHQEVNLPTGLGELNNFTPKFLINTAGPRQFQPLQLFYTRISATVFDLYCNDDSIDVLCVWR